MNRLIRHIVLILVIPIVTLGQQIDYDTTFTSNGQKFGVQRSQLDKYMTLLKITRGKTIILTDTLDFSIHFKLVDFNGDNGVDVMVNFMGNVDTQSLFLFDKSKNEFKKVKDFEKYPTSKKVSGSDSLYYSYHRSGCADNYWTSDLFKIVAFKVIHVGQIFGAGCEDPKQVKIYKVGQNRKDLIETLPYKLVEDSKDNKWGFIENYWSKNYSRFK